MCDDLKVQEFATANEKSLNCWIYNFEEFVTGPIADPDPTTTAEKNKINPDYKYTPRKGDTFPVQDPVKFNKYIEDFLNTQDYKTD